MEEYSEQTQKVIKISKKKLVWSVVIIIAGGLVWLGSAFYKANIPIGVGGTLQSNMMPGIPNNSIMPRGDSNNINIEDTREFMKTSYSGTVQTRDVTDVMREVEETVRDLDGRVDNINSSTKSGYISFVIPKDDLFEFKYRIEQLTHKKLYVESTSSRNLLGQKQNIEERTEETSQTLDELEASKASLDSAHAQRIGALQGELSSVQKQISDLQQQMTDSPTYDSLEDQVDFSDITQQLQVLFERQNQLKQSQTNENKSYSSQSSSLVSQMGHTEGTLTDLAEEDTDFMTDVETVNGTVYVKWISTWNLMKVFSPIPIGFEIVILVAIIWYILKRKKYIPKVELI